MRYSKKLIKEAHKYSSYHRYDVEESNICGCFYCRRFFSPKQIKEWIDEGMTALCPHCGIDSVLGLNSRVPICDTFLEAMHKYWFAIKELKE